MVISACIKLSNKTHRSIVDPDALLARKSNAHPAQPSYREHLLMDNRHALIVDCKVTQATGDVGWRARGIDAEYSPVLVLWPICRLHEVVK